MFGIYQVTEGAWGVDEGLPASGWGLGLDVHGVALKLAWGREALCCSKGAGWLPPHQTPPGCPIVSLATWLSFPWPSSSGAPLARAMSSTWGPGPKPGLLSMQVLGLVRVPLYTQKDRVGGFPNFLSNAFISTAKYQLLFALKVLNMMPEEKLAEALAAATEKQKKALEKLLPSSS